VRRARTGIALVLVAAVAGCGSGDKQPRLTRVQAQALTAELEAVRVGAAARDLAATKSALLRFRRSVARLQRDGAISPERARALRIGAARVLRRVQSDSAPVQAAPPATQTTPAPAPPGHKKKHEEKKHGKGGKHGGDGEGGD
jgi:hypothetical protein